MNGDTKWTTIKHRELIVEIEYLRLTHSRLSFKNLLCAHNVQDYLDVATSLNTKAPHQIFYHIENNLLTIPECQCGSTLAWHPDSRAYRTYCSKSCTAKYSAITRKQTNLELFGKEWHTQTTEWKEKVEQTSLEKFGVTHYSKTDEWSERTTSTNLAKYGTKSPAQSVIIQDKIKETNMRTYGTEYGCQNSAVIDKMNNTNLQRYGCKKPFQNADIQAKIKNTFMENYGVDNPLKCPTIRKKAVATTRTAYYTTETFSKIEDPIWLHLSNKGGKSVGEIANDIGVSGSNLCKIFHKHNLRIIKHQVSELERKLVAAFNIPLLTNDRILISPRELDIVFPAHSLAVEVNGSYYHSEKFGRDSDYHLQKTTQCNDRGIELLQFWDTEINKQFPKVVNFINSKLGLCERLYARKTKIRHVTAYEKKNFINSNHLQNDVGSSINLGLFSGDTLVMVATFGKPRFTKADNTFELLRLCSLSGFVVTGGAGKLIKYFVNQHMSDGDILLSYCNRRYSSGNVYEKIGFTLTSISPPSFFYITASGKYAGSRYQWQKHLLKDKLKNFDPSISAFKNMKNNGFEKVWDCGQLVYTLEKVA